MFCPCMHALRKRRSTRMQLKPKVMRRQVVANRAVTFFVKSHQLHTAASETEKGVTNDELFHLVPAQIGSSLLFISQWLSS